MTFAPDRFPKNEPVSTGEFGAVNGDAQLSPTQLAFAARIFNAYEKTMSDRERLSHLYVINREQFDEELETEIDSYLSEDPEYQALFAKLKEARTRGNDKGEEFIPEIRSRHARARELIVAALSLPEKAKVIDSNESQRLVEELLKDIPRDPQNANRALEVLGCRVVSEDESVHYTFPYELLPESLTKKWGSYLDSALAEKAAADRIANAKGLSKDEKLDLEKAREAADLLRRVDHNIIAQNVSDILKLADFGYNLQQTRHLLGQMRDEELALPEPLHSHADKSAEEIAVEKHLHNHNLYH